MRRRVFTLGLLLLVAGCGVVLGLDPPTYDGPIATPDAAPDTAPVDAGAPVLPGKLDDPTRWATYKEPGARYMAGPFDGRFVYFVRAADVDGPDAGLTGSRILRYDTTSTAFDDPKAWTSFDPEVSLGAIGPHVAAVMDGKYLIVAALTDEVFLRFDTTLPETDFGFASSWETFSAANLGGFPLSYVSGAPIPGGAVFNNGAGYTPLVHKGAQLDAGWEVAVFDGGTFPCAATYNAACTNTTVFFPPAGSDTIACLAKYDVSKPLQTGFESIDLATLGEDWTFIASGLTSSQHLYLTQYNTKDAAAPVAVLRKPIDGALDAGWERQPTNVKNPLARGFVGGTYDGRFVYFAPYPAPTNTVIFERYDTSLGFNDPNAWDVAAGAAVGVPANRFWSAVFDGQYVYYPSYQALGNDTPAFARFKAYDQKVPVPPACRP